MIPEFMGRMGDVVCQMTFSTIQTLHEENKLGFLTGFALTKMVVKTAVVASATTLVAKKFSYSGTIPFVLSGITVFAYLVREHKRNDAWGDQRAEQTALLDKYNEKDYPILGSLLAWVFTRY